MLRCERDEDFIGRDAVMKELDEQFNKRLGWDWLELGYWVGQQRENERIIVKTYCSSWYLPQIHTQQRTTPPSSPNTKICTNEVPSLVSA